MEEIKYPAARPHREQHARVLAGMHHVHSSLIAGNVGIARKVVSLLLPDWLYCRWQRWMRHLLLIWQRVAPCTMTLEDHARLFQIGPIFGNKTQSMPRCFILPAFSPASAPKPQK